MRSLIFSAALFGLWFASSAAVDECFTPGQCRDSQFLSGDFTSDEYDCHDLCEKDPECHFYTFVPEVSYCELLFNCSYIDSATCPDCLTSSIDCQLKEPLCWLQGECKGILDHFEITESKEECLDLCKSTPDCKWFTFQEPSSPCFLFKDCPTVDESCKDCISGEQRCKQPPKGLSKLIVTTLEGNSILVLNLDESQPDLVCDDLPPYPGNVRGITGKLFQGKTPILCGGGDYSCDCYALSNGSWTSIDSLKTCRVHASSVLLTLQIGESLEEHMLVIGGAINNIPTITDSIEVYDGNSWLTNIVPDRPEEQTQFCTVKINETHIISLGGIFNFEKGSFFYNSLENQWTQGPDLAEDRNGLACGILNWLNPETGAKEKVVVAASGDYLKDSELLFLKDYYESGTGWVQGPALPAVAFLPSMVEFDDSVILVGGSDGGGFAGVDGYHLYKLDSPYGSWMEMEQTLKKEHHNGAAFLVPDELVNCY